MIRALGNRRLSLKSAFGPCASSIQSNLGDFFGSSTSEGFVLSRSFTKAQTSDDALTQEHRDLRISNRDYQVRGALQHSIYNGDCHVRHNGAYFNASDRDISFWRHRFSATAFVACPSSTEASRLDKAPKVLSKTAREVDPLWNWPNGISLARLLSGPVIAYLIYESHWEAAFISLGISGLSDWLDGFIARRFDQGSVIGSYLDPLADKVLICCTVGMLAHQGYLYKPLAVLIIGRDIFLVAGAIALRLQSFHWQWPGWQEFFRTTTQASTPNSTKYVNHRPEGTLQEGGKMQPDNKKGTETSLKPAEFVKPLYISKVNTVAQITLVAGCLTSSKLGWPASEAVLGLGALTGGLTIASGLAYWRGHQAKNKTS